MKIGFIDYYLDEWHALNYPAWIKEASRGDMEAVYAYASADGTGFGRRSNEETADILGLQLLPSIEDLIEASDALIVLSPDNPEQHLELCRLPLQSGKPVYVDKTFSPDLATARQLIQLAEENRTPMYSTSALRYAKAYQQWRGQRILSVQSFGGGKLENYVIHQIEPLVMLMGNEIKSVKAWGSEHAPSFLIRWKDGRTASVTVAKGDHPFSMLVHPENGDSMQAAADDNYFASFIEDLCAFFRDREPRVSSDTLLANMALREALLKAAEIPGIYFDLPDF